MKLLITGAGGFLGHYVVWEAVKRKHKVRAVIRPAAKAIPEEWKNHPQIEIVRADLRSKKNLENILNGVDSIIHLAAAKTGDLYEQFGGTVLGTENLLSAMTSVGINRIVLISTFSVYEYLNKRSWSILNEDSELARKPLIRDEYCQTKLIQEELVRKLAVDRDWRCIILRPGVLFGRNNLWTARLGMQSDSGRWITTGRFALLPFTYVENCAEAILLASEYNGSVKINTLNVVDDKSPTQGAYSRFLRSNMEKKPHVIAIPWWMIRSLARIIWGINNIVFKGTAKIPGLFVPARLHARCKPLRYSNNKIKTVLRWKPRFTWKEGVIRALGTNVLPEIKAEEV